MLMAPSPMDSFADTHDARSRDAVQIRAVARLACATAHALAPVLVS
jgi:hypothetical protein